MKHQVRIISAALFAIVLTSCGGHKENNDKEEEYVMPAVKAVEGQPTTILSLPGELIGYYETEIYPKVNSYVKALFCDIGDKVKKGQLLSELEAPELTSKLSEGYSKFKAAEAVFLNTKSKYIRLQQTNKTAGAVSPYDMDLSRTNVTSDSLNFVASQSNYNALAELVSYLKIYAPFDGTITERNISPGAFVGPAEKNVLPILVVKTQDLLRLHISVPEKHISAISENQEVNFTVTSYPERKFSGKVTRASSNLNVQLRAEVIEIEIPNKDGALIPGMFAKVEIPLTRHEKTVIVPETAVITSMERCFVIKVNGDKAKVVDVQKGNTSKGFVEIFGNIKAGDVILKEGSEEIKDGDTIHCKI